MGDNVFPGTPEFPGLPNSGPAMSTAATSVIMPATPSSESVAKGRGKDLDKLTGKWSSSDSSQIPSKKPWKDSMALRVSFANTSGLTPSTQYRGRLLSSLLTLQSSLTQLGMHPLANHSSSGISAPPQTPGDLKALDKMCNEVTQLWAAYRDWIQGTFWFWDEDPGILSLLAHVGHEASMGPQGSTRIVARSPPDGAGELELCLQSTILHYVAEHHQGLSKRGQAAFITQRKVLEDMEASCHQHISGCLSRLQLPTAEQAELPIYLSLLLPAPVRTGPIFGWEHVQPRASAPNGALHLPCKHCNYSSPSPEPYSSWSSSGCRRQSCQVVRGGKSALPTLHGG